MKYYRNPFDGELASVNDKHPDLQEQLEGSGWVRIAGRKDITPYKKVAKKKAPAKKKKKK